MRAMNLMKEWQLGLLRGLEALKTSCFLLEIQEDEKDPLLGKATEDISRATHCPSNPWWQEDISEEHWTNTLGDSVVSF